MSPILGPNGQPVVSAERVKTEKQSRFNPTVNWTPDVLVRQLTSYARGEIRDLMWVMEWLEQTDDTIAQVAPKAKSAVSRHGFDIQVREGVDDDQRELAEKQREVLQAFYDNIDARHAIDKDVRGNFRLLVQQVMDAYGKGLAAHHVIWSATPDGLRARLVQVPAWFWETTEGTARFLPSTWAIRGVDREAMGGPSAWMISRGRGVMLACTIARMFKQIPLQDWLTYCDRHGMPAFLGKTGSAQGSSGWNQLYDAVTNIGSEFGAVVNTGDEISVLNLTSQGELPYEKLIERMDRAMVSLWRGGDLSTMSRESGVGSNPQQEETDELDADNAVWVAETIDGHLSRPVLEWNFGEGVPQLAELVLRTRTRDNVEQDLKIVSHARESAVRVSKPWYLSKFGIVEADDDEEALGDASENPESSGKNPEQGTGDDEADGEEVSAVNTVSVRDLVAEVAGVSAEMLGPVADLIQELEGRDDLSDDEWLDFAEEAALRMPEFFDQSAGEDLAAAMERGLAASMVQGVREASAKTEGES